MGPFWSKAKKNSNGCWIWGASINAKGYGSFRLNPKKTGLAHRISYELTKGKIPKGLVIDHLCKNHACINPDHMEVVTNEENLARGKNGCHKKGMCKRGHNLFNEVNYFVDKRGYKICRICSRIMKKAYRKGKPRTTRDCRISA